MKNKIFLSVLTLLIFSSMAVCYGVEQAAVSKDSSKGCNCPVCDCKAPKDFPPPQKGHHMMPPPNQQDMKAKKAEFEAKKAEFEKRLELTEEQKAQIRANKEKDRETMKPVIEQIRAKHIQYAKIDTDNSLSDEAKEKQKQELKKEIKALKVQADNLRKENMKHFESVLTEKQKKEFDKIKKEQKQEIEKKHKEMAKNIKDGKEIGLPVMPPPPKYEK
ncbi:Spy/CpxP family protein refolding chaperone [bacterium]|nr:Spy/CpxP family protein refolding chaperone [bacterium]